MYNFTDTISHGSGSSRLPAEALQINGVFIENVIPGYRTLYTSGRELLAPELNVLELAKRHGSIYRSRRYPPRTITVGFQLIAANNEEFREYFNTLNSILYVEEAQLIFADEPDKCFYGTLSEIDNPEPGKNAITGTFSFMCCDPFKYAIEEIEAEPSTADTISINYGGTVESYPKLEVSFPKHGGNGVCSYLAFKDTRGNTIQISGVDTGEFVDNSPVSNLVYDFFYMNIQMLYCADDIYCSDSLYCCLNRSWTLNQGVFMAGDDTVTTDGTVMVSGEGADSRLMAETYGSGDSFHGPAIYADVSDDEVKEFELTFQNYLETDDIAEKGAFIATLNNSSDTVVASLALIKKEEQQTVDALIIINDVVRKQVTLSLPLSNLTSRIAKKGQRLEFTFDGRNYTFYDSSLENSGINYVAFLFGAYADDDPLSVNSLEWARLTNGIWEFTSNDAVIADCRSATIKMNDINRPGLDVISNDWENFTLKPGANTIRIEYKSNSSKAPAFKVKYREVFL